MYSRINAAQAGVITTSEWSLHLVNVLAFEIQRKLYFECLMSDVAFSNEWRHISSHLFALPGVVGCAEEPLGVKVLQLSASVLSEAKRILRLCLIKKLSISSDAQHERAFCLFCAIATRYPIVWEALLGRIAERRVATVRIPNAGEYNINDIKKFIRVATVTLGLAVAPPHESGAVAPQTLQEPTNAAGKGGVRNGKNTQKRPHSEPDVAITSDEASLMLHGSKFDISSSGAKQQPQKPSLKVKPPTAKKRGRHAAADPDESGSDDDRLLLQSGSVSSFLVSARNWNEITNDVVMLLADRPVLLRSDSVAKLLGTAAGDATQSVVTNDEERACNKCGEAIVRGAVVASPDGVSEHKLPASLVCSLCRTTVHRLCVVPRTIEFILPFVCTECRVRRAIG